jgi:hypothetical protein
MCCVEKKAAFDKADNFHRMVPRYALFAIFLFDLLSCSIRIFLMKYLYVKNCLIAQ